MTAHAKPSGPNLHNSVELLHTSVYLGVVTANLDRVVDANDAFLSMIGYTRDELESGLIDWRAMTPPDSLAKDEIALNQLREYGASVPFEKEYILRDGSQVSMLMGAIRLTREPLEWMCYVVNLTDRKRAEEAESRSRELQAKHDVVNQIAHELNNPLAALTFLVSAMQFNPAALANAEMRSFLADAECMVARIAALTRAVLAAGAEPTSTVDPVQARKNPLPEQSSGETASI